MDSISAGGRYNENIEKLDNNIYILTELIQDDIQYYIYYQTRYMDKVTDTLQDQIGRFMVAVSYTHLEVYKRQVLDVDFRLQHVNGEFQWVNLSGSITFDENKERSRIVGCIHNVHQHKLLEQAQKRKQIYDSITSFYRLGSGLEVVETLCRDDPEGVLVLLEIQQFSKIDERYGLLFGDIILEQFAGMLAKRFQEDGLNGGIYIRAGAEQMLIWLPVCTTGPIVSSVQRLEKDFRALDVYKRQV